jgi:serine/threonine protein phosphatase PrpC
MKIVLRKVSNTPLDFEVKSDKITFKGYLQYYANKLILLKAKLSGKIDTDCDVCADKFKLNVDEDIEFFISDGIYKNSEDTLLLDIVESLNSTVDLEELMNSEIELIKSDYHRCEKCENIISKQEIF